MIPVELREQRGRASYNYKNAKGEIITSAQYRNLSKEKRKEFVKTTEIERKVRECVSYSGIGWGRDKNEDDEHFRRRCLQTARRMMKKPIVEKKRNGWHR